MELRNYQEKFVGDLSQKIASGITKVVGQLPTGGGKTVSFSAISHRYVTRSKKSVLILVHRKELLQQTRKTLYKLYEIVAHPIVAGSKYIPVSDVYVGMVESVGRRINRLQNIGLVIIDEAHIASFNKIHAFFPNAYIIGVTATPQSASKKNPMKNHYDDIVCSIDIPDMIAQGFLAQNITIAPKEVVNRAELSMKGSDFNDGVMGEKFSAPKYIQSTLYAYEKYSQGKKTIVFNVNVAHSLRVTEAFRIAGYNCRHIDGGTPKGEREAAFEWLAKTPNAILCNVGIATTGFDEPTIETVIVNKATMSMPLWLQMAGRGGRVTPTKSAFTIIDMGGNAITHGDWSNARDWVDLFKNPKKPSKSDQVAPCKSCENCDAIIAAGARTCKFCGYVYPVIETREEGLLTDFIVVTKGIDVKAVMEANKDKKEFFTFFQMARDLAIEVKKSVKVLTEKEVPIILEQYFDLAKQWCHAKGKKFGPWFKEKGEITMYRELLKQYPKWKPPIELPEEYKKPEQPVAAAPAPARAPQPFLPARAPGSHLTNLYEITL